MLQTSPLRYSKAPLYFLGKGYAIVWIAFCPFYAIRTSVTFNRMILVRSTMGTVKKNVILLYYSVSLAKTLLCLSGWLQYHCICSQPVLQTTGVLAVSFGAALIC